MKLTHEVKMEAYSRDEARHSENRFHIISDDSCQDINSLSKHLQLRFNVHNGKGFLILLVLKTGMVQNIAKFKKAVHPHDTVISKFN